MLSRLNIHCGSQKETSSGSQKQENGNPANGSFGHVPMSSPSSKRWRWCAYFTSREKRRSRCCDSVEKSPKSVLTMSPTWAHPLLLEGWFNWIHLADVYSLRSVLFDSEEDWDQYTGFAYTWLAQSVEGILGNNFVGQTHFSSLCGAGKVSYKTKHYCFSLTGLCVWIKKSCSVWPRWHDGRICFILKGIRIIVSLLHKMRKNIFKTYLSVPSESSRRLTT